MSKSKDVKGLADFVALECFDQHGSVGYDFAACTSGSENRLTHQFPHVMHVLIWLLEQPCNHQLILHLEHSRTTSQTTSKCTSTWDLQRLGCNHHSGVACHGREARWRSERQCGLCFQQSRSQACMFVMFCPRPNLEDNPHKQEGRPVGHAHRQIARTSASRQLV